MKYFICNKDNKGIEIREEISMEKYKEYKNYMGNIEYYSLAKHLKKYQ